ncbi:MAG: permease YjgP/YjgQ family protein [Rhizobacter sp.]|nr:permease YjgP/YjgQ family protein [Rhizobacter sp.]
MLPFAFDRLDRYAIRLLAGPLAMSLVTLLLATLLGRLLRLFDLAASTGVGPVSVMWLAGNLVPHYLGLALPMAFTAAVFMASARMCDDNELDVMLGTGRSIARVAAPYFMLALLLSVFNVYLFGQLQPLTRYNYHIGVDAALNTAWDAKVEENRFIDTGEGFSFSADAVESDGRHLRGVFAERRNANGEEITTAARGLILPAPDGHGLLLRLEDGLIVRERKDGSVTTARFEHGHVIDLSPQRAALRVRGESTSERTMFELWRDIGTGDRDSAAEFHGRLARILLPPLLPLLAMPLGMASKRGHRGPGIVFASLALLALNHSLQFGQSLAESGHVAPVTAVWTPFALFALLSLWIFCRSLAWPGDNPVSRAVVAFEHVVERLRPQRRPGGGA